MLYGAHRVEGARRSLQLLLILWRTIQDHDTLFVLAEIAHFVGVGLLGYKVMSKKSVAGERRAKTSTHKPRERDACGSGRQAA